jgi:hypothetical protein
LANKSIEERASGAIPVDLAKLSKKAKAQDTTKMTKERKSINPTFLFFLSSIIHTA